MSAVSSGISSIGSSISEGVSDIGSSIGDFGAAMDPTTSEGLTNIGTSIGTGGLSGLGTLFGGTDPSQEFANLDDSLNEWASNFDDRVTQPGLEGLQEMLGGAFGGGMGGGVNTALIGERFDQIAAPGIETGRQAQQQQAAFSGALGPEAQMQAFQGFQDSPGTQFLRERGMRGRNSSSAMTGRGGGGLMAELSRFNQGLALQDLDRQQQQLGQLAQQGLQAGQLGTSLTGIESGAISNQQALDAQGQAAQQNLIGQGIGLLGSWLSGRPGSEVSSSGNVTATGGLRSPAGATTMAPGVGGPPSPMAGGATGGQGLVPGQTPAGQGFAPQGAGIGRFADALNQVGSPQSGTLPNQGLAGVMPFLGGSFR